MKIVGVTGYAQSGKDTVGQYMGSVWLYKRIAFADAVRDAVYAMNPIIGGPTTARVSDAVDLDGWDVAKTQIPEVRRLLQVMGTEVGRMLFGEKVWIDIARRKMEGLDKVVITDVRFANEADFIHECGGVVFRVDRPGVGPRNGHASEVIDFEVDHILQNWGTTHDLYDEIDSVLSSME